MKRTLSLLAVLALGDALAHAADPADAVVARGKGIEVRQSELNAAFAHYRAELLTNTAQIPASGIPG